ncbi:lymphocyte activation gene 3 protein [Tachyglossus aculeatus]|uniref:lymphocyte activation gene 3 protein n=1 Tax=Tachyglossus aculeatus TaxID=9261 RepID=UPI0018F5B1C1|nr:lymphocyte activation gene 3 protein [Tachyglossus aculeatus]
MLGRLSSELLLLLLLLPHLPSGGAAAGSQGPEKEESGSGARVVWAEAGSPVRLPCGLGPRERTAHRASLLRGAAVSWKHRPDRASSSWYTVLAMEPSGLKRGRRPRQQRAQLRGLDFLRGDFSLRLLPARRPDAGDYRAAVSFGDRTLRCLLRLSVAAVTADPPGTLVASDRVSLTCSSSRLEPPVFSLWFRGDTPIVSPTPGLLFLPHVTVAHAGHWRCQLFFSDGSNVSVSHRLHVLGLEPPEQQTIYVGAGSPAKLPCRLTPGPGVPAVLGARWSLPRGGVLPVEGVNGSFALRLDKVTPERAGTYHCNVSLLGHWLSTTVTLAAITVTSPDSPGPAPAGSRRRLLCAVTPARGDESFLWTPPRAAPRPRDALPPVGPWLELEKEGLQAGPWTCSLFLGRRCLGSAAGPLGLPDAGAQVAGATPHSASPSRLLSPLGLSFGLSFLLLVAIGAVALLRRRGSRRPRTFPALENQARDPRKEDQDQL